MPIQIDTAGLHPTTESCLEAMQFLHALPDYAPGRILDMGCGAGILGIVAASIWEAQVLAADIAEKAVADARSNIAQRGLEGRIEVLRSDGFSHPRIKAGAPYDLIIINLLAEQLVQMSPDLRACLAPGGYCLLSGSLAWLADGVELAYRSLGFEIIHEIPNAPWQSWVMRY